MQAGEQKDRLVLCLPACLMSVHPQRMDGYGDMQILKAWMAPAMCSLSCEQLPISAAGFSLAFCCSHLFAFCQARFDNN